MRMNYEDEGRSRIFGPGLREKRYDTEVPRDTGGPLALFVMNSFALSLFCCYSGGWNGSVAEGDGYGMAGKDLRLADAAG